jgi:hypothetical protein
MLQRPERGDNDAAEARSGGEIARPDFVVRTNHMTRLALSTVSLAIVLAMTHPVFADPLANSV